MFDLNNATVKHDHSNLPDFASLKVGELFLWAGETAEGKAQTLTKIKLDDCTYMVLISKEKNSMIDTFVFADDPHAARVRRVTLKVSEVVLLD